MKHVPFSNFSCTPIWKRKLCFTCNVFKISVFV